MATRWSLTVDSADPAALARFWAEALGYVERPAPEGFANWPEWLLHHGVPEDEWNDGAYLRDPDGTGPGLSFLKVPERKVVKNRLHLDVQAGGGRETPWEMRWPRVLAAAERLTAAGARVLREETLQGRPDHLVLADPEGNEFCVV
ncbi:VOC family protein [Streptomyces sp. NBC_01306]|uniref:VOC family protein n=1 Tax=Streptomyces sp. NBC_01306 TaxID=2903819 RepID=UPI002258DFB2|nr:VOC family protein [Streptomyces sp. NBC_01306]MCX4725718.1 VOC family protein [Streptomyces sp. NBC_01306]